LVRASCWPARPNERHTLALIVFGIALHELGWRVTYLGADTPIDTLAEVAKLIAPELTVMAATMPRRMPRYAQQLSGFGEKWALALGGPGVSIRLAKQIGARHLREDPVTAAGLVSSL
jgi:methanogenic corrinoid protein MtbC1